MTEMIICGLTMEIKLAEEMGWIGKCVGCRYLEYGDYCRKKGRHLKERKENCSLNISLTNISFKLR